MPSRTVRRMAEGVGDGGVVFCDLPQLPPGPMGRFFLTLMAAVAELEAGLISQRTKAALAARKAQGKSLGGARIIERDPETIAAANAARTANADEVVRDVLPYIAAAQAAGATSLRAIAAALVARGVRTPFGGTRWTATQVSRVLARGAPIVPSR
jgi:DNA invertase Pin-like site-specific DNA recombinase